ncbi:MAG: hypothetical protein JNM66_15695 [Bryobacterales bacterium]|nr:hypothetical protein [Bryobacterales bacterium]
MELLVVGVSRRADGRSLIGYGQVRPGNWGFTRLVAPTPSGVLYPEHHRMGELVEPRPYDLIRVEAPWADGRAGQPENRVVDDTPWELLERPASRGYLERLEGEEVSEGPLFGTEGRSVRDRGDTGGESILYVAPMDPRAICRWDPSRERYLARLGFRAGGVSYELPLTDWHYATKLRSRGEGEWDLTRLGCRAPHGLRLLVTLGEPFHGWRYKMVESILAQRTLARFAASA